MVCAGVRTPLVTRTFLRAAAPTQKGNYTIERAITPYHGPYVSFGGWIHDGKGDYMMRQGLIYGRGWLRGSFWGYMGHFGVVLQDAVGDYMMRAGHYRIDLGRCESFGSDYTMREAIAR